MIPYSTCMRFNTRKRSLNDDKYSPSEWTLIQHFDSNEGIAPAFISISSQDDQTLCFSWSLDPQVPFDVRRDSVTSSLSTERRESDELDEKSVYLFLTLRRRKSLQQSIHSEAISLLDLCYYGITERYLRQSYRWSFNTFSLDILSGGHSLSSLLLYLFNEYQFISHFQLDLINVLRCFYYLENGYHDTNPYHNSVHAADVTQAMHCFLQEPKIREHLTPIEAMCSLLAAVSHDLDHPGVNQNFLVATKSHLAALYNNFSVLESHHWRFALSCFYESHIFDHLSKDQWSEIEYLLRHLILATDISRQSEYIQQFRDLMRPDGGLCMSKRENKHFILQIALKCADLGNPCRPWNISQKWSVQICNEFYRQGDFERQLNLPITTICDRQTMTIPKIQTEFFKNIVRPLFELWNQFLDSSLSRQLINNLNFNDYMWNTMEASEKPAKKRVGKRIQSNLLRSNSASSIHSVLQDKCEVESLKRSKSLLALSSISLTSCDSSVQCRERVTDQVDKEKSAHKCVNGCGTPPACKDDKSSSSDKSSKTDDPDFDEEDDFITDRFNDDCGAILSTPALLLPKYYLEKSYYSSRRGSAPGCIDIRKNDLNTTKTAALFLLRNSVKTNSGKRRSSFPAVKISNLPLNSNANLQANLAHAAKMSKMRGRSLDLNAKNAKCKGPYYGKYRATGGTKPHEYFRGQQSSLYDVSTVNYVPYQVFLTNLGNQRRRSVPQEIFIRSLKNYTA